MKKALALAMLAMAANQAAGQGLTYPTPPTDNTVDEYFGVKVADPYRPLENDHSEATMQWVEAENQVTQDYLAKIPFRGKLLKRLREVSDYGKVGAPFYVKATGKWYFYKNNGLQNQSVLYEMDGLGQEKNARVFLDPNQLSTDGTVALGNISFSPRRQVLGLRHLAFGQRLVGVLCDGHEDARGIARPHRVGQVLGCLLARRRLLL